MIDQLIPVINPSDWRGAQYSACRPFFANNPNSPLLISYAVVTPESNANLSPEALAESGMTLEAIESESLARWVAHNQQLDWVELELPGDSQKAMAVRGRSDVISTILLSNGHLKGMHKYFGTEIIHILIPDRFTVIIHPFSLGLNSLAEGMYQDAIAQGTQLSPYVYQSMNGEVVGYSKSDPGVQPAQKNEVDLLKAASVVIGGAFIMVAAADGNIDKKEIISFGEQLKAIAQSGDALAHQACAHIIRTDFEVINEFLSDGIDPVVMMAVLQKCMSIIDESAGSQEAATLRLVARQIAKKVASASGGGFLGFGSKTSKEEKTAMSFLEILLA